ncbi:ribonuclease E inhibitor RraB [Intrasporangium flavum]|uniref:ribonuclease E inhibitor RraB n=1 Tax=Intrasporangium flavum TaxID=1428657 RepID=UPI001F612036|nr:ribonuclease E inhibitor RraB [Intrasporangium flavum]
MEHGHPDDVEDADARDGIEHLVVLPERDVAEEVAEQLAAEGLTQVRVVREALAGEDDSEDHEWAVHVRTPDDPAWADRLTALAEAHDGWYDAEPGA